MEKENLLHMNLQFFAETEETAEQETKTETEQKGGESKSEQEVDAKSLNEQLQSALVEIAKLKREKDKNASEAAEFKKKYRESLSETEKASQEKAEAQAKRDAEFEDMKKTIQIHDLTENFMDLGYPKDLAKKAATAQADGDTTTLLDIQKQFNDFQKKQWEADFYASRPDVNIGGTSGKTYTKEQFDKMNPIELTQLKRENEAEYNRLLAM